MAKKKVVLILLMVLFCSYGIRAQGLSDIRINEVLVYNENTCIDNYGEHSGWFEIYNLGNRTINIGGWFLTNDINNSRKYRIPKSDPNTILSPGERILFYADGESSRGTFHVNFTLSDTDCLIGDSSYLAIYDQSGKVMVDSFLYSLASVKADVSWGKKDDEGWKDKNAEWVILPEPTPQAENVKSSGETRAEAIGRKDPHGLIITLTCMAVVFIILFLVSVVFKYTGRYFQQQNNKKNANEPVKPAEPRKLANTAAGNREDEVAAIAMALHLYFNDMHETEATGFHLNRGLNQHSAWENKSMIFRKSPIQK